MRTARTYYEELVKKHPELGLEPDWGTALGVGVVTSTLKQYEQGRRISDMTHERASEILDSVHALTRLPAVWLWADDPPIPAMTSVERDETIKETQRLVKAILALGAASAEASRQQTDEVLGAIRQIRPGQP